MHILASFSVSTWSVHKARTKKSCGKTSSTQKQLWCPAISHDIVCILCSRLGCLQQTKQDFNKVLEEMKQVLSSHK